MKIRSSFYGAFLFTAAIAAYIGSGYLDKEQQKQNDAEQLKIEQAVKDAATALTTVQVMAIKAAQQVATISLPAQSETSNRVHVAAETGGIVIELPIEKGQMVKAGDLLCKIDLGTRESDLAQAEANLVQAQIDYNSAVKLVKLGHVAKTTETARKAQLDGATAAVKRAAKEIERVEIKAPFGGVVENIPSKIGSLLNPGMECATISDGTIMLIVGHISERDISRIGIGLQAKIVMVTGDEFAGELTYIAAAANPKTRTFRVDITVNNEKNLIRDGMTSQISIELEKNKAHFIKKSLLTLNDNGVIGVRLVDDQNIVQFHPVTILSDKRDGVWIAGLEDEVNIISIGHEYVQAGQKVNVVTVTAEVDNG